MPWRMLQPEDLQVVRDWARDTLPPASQKRLVAAVNAAVRDDHRRALAEEALPVSAPPRLRPPAGGAQAGVTLGSRAARLLLESVREDRSAAGHRDCAVLSLLLLAGLRRCELVRLDASDFQPEDGSLAVKSRARLRRSVFLTGSCRRDVESWLEARGSGRGPLFLALNAAGPVLNRGLSAPAVNLILSRRARAAGAGCLTPRDLRQRFLRQLRSQAGGQGRAAGCRFYKDGLGQSGWALPSLAEA